MSTRFPATRIAAAKHATPGSAPFALLTLLVMAGAWAAEPTVPQGPLRASAPARVAKPATSVYIVTLKEPGAATYSGGVTGFAATRPIRGEKLDRNAGDVASYVRHLEQTHAELLAEVGAQGAKIYSLSYALNGFAANLTPAQATALAQHARVDRIWLDADHKVQTNNSSVFLGLLDPSGGLRADRGLTGEGVVIAVIDSGIAPDHPSLADIEPQIPRACSGDWAENSWLGHWLCGAVRRNPPTIDLYEPPPGFAGTCQEGEGFTVAHCNDKVVGARFYIDGFLNRHTLDDGEFISPKDADGHGTHIATTIAGNSVSASLFGTRVARISGIAPRARIAVYKACWLKPGELRATCTTADLARAIDDAVADGVDIINYSVGSLEEDLAAPDDLAMLNAFDAGVLSIVAAGNEGPTLGTIGSPASAPWVLSVAASTQGGTAFEEAIEVTAPAAVAGRIAMREAGFTPELRSRAAISADVILADDQQTVVVSGRAGSTRDACEPLVNDAAVDGNIALIERGNCDFEVKLEHAELAGAIGVIVYNNSGPPFIMNGRAGRIGIPAVMIGAADGQRLVDRLTNDEVVTVTLEKGVFLNRALTGNQMALFSSRGPALSEPDFLKPDVTAPGVDILAGHTRDAANGLKGESFQYLTGTSMSAPEAAGVAALLKEAKPDWSPAALKSALMTSAYTNVASADGPGDAHPFDRGAGHVDPNRAFDPGLVYESNVFDYAAYLCGTEKPPFPPTDCEVLELAGFSSEPREVNVPSFGISELIRGDLVTRRVTNTGPAATFRAQITRQPFGIDVTVDPPTLTLGTGETGDFNLVFETTTPDFELWTFGELQWTDGLHEVTSPLAMRPVQLRFPAEINLPGSSGDGTYPTDFGYSGPYEVTVHGLNPPFYLEQSAFIADDPTNTFSFRNSDGVVQHHLTVAPGDLYLRIATFDELTDGNDDLDLYLYYCPNGSSCVQVGESGTFTSEEQIDLAFPAPGEYVVLVHGFETDELSGGPGANYALFAWTFSETDGRDNLTVTIPTNVGDGDRYDITIDWSNLDPDSRYFGGILHYTPRSSPQPYGITLVTAQGP